jgi:hypothetical protein
MLRRPQQRAGWEGRGNAEPADSEQLSTYLAAAIRGHSSICTRATSL